MTRAVRRAADAGWHGLTWLGRGIRTWFEEFLRHRGFQHAAAMSYFAALSFIPMLVLLVAGFGFVVHLLGPEFGSEARILRVILRAVEDIAPFATEMVEDRLRDLVQAREAIGVVGISFLFLGSSLVFGATETALKEIFERTPQKLLISRLLFFLFLAALGTLLIFLHVVRVIVGSWVEALGDRSIIAALTAYPAIDWIVSFAILGGGFVVMVVYFGHRRLRIGALALGATLFYALFSLSRWAFALYVKNVARLDVAYGSLATLVTGFLWVFYAATVFLLSAEFVRLMDRRLRIHDGTWVEPERRHDEPRGDATGEKKSAVRKKGSAKGEKRVHPRHGAKGPRQGPK